MSTSVKKDITRPQLHHNVMESIGWIYGIIFTCIAVYLMPIQNGYYLKWVESMNFFDDSAFEFNHLMAYPGGLLQYAGSFLTQLLFYPWVGSVVLIVLWGIIVVLCISTFQLKGYGIGAAFIVPLGLLNSLLNLDEYLLVLYSKGLAYSPTLGFLFVTASVWIVAHCRQSIKVVLSCILPFLYPWLGFYALLGCLLCILMTKITRKSVIAISVGMIVAISVPQIYYLFRHGTWTDDGNLYLKGLPDFIAGVADAQFWLPYITMVSVMIFLCVGFRCKMLSKRITVVGMSILLLMVTGWDFSLGRKPEAQRAMIMMQQSMDENNWNRVVRLASNLREAPSPDVLTIAKLASQKTGKGVRIQEAKREPNRTHPRLQSSVVSTALISVPVSYHIGESNLSYRWAMEHSIKYGKNVFLLKYMVRCSLLNGDFKLAQKYNSMLQKTLFHKSWASRYQQFIDNPSLMQEDDEFKTMPSREEAEKVFF